MKIQSCVCFILIFFLVSFEDKLQVNSETILEQSQKRQGTAFKND